MKTTTSRFKTAILIIIAVFSIQVKAQDVCGYGMAHDYFMATDSAYARNSVETEARIKEIIQNQSQQRIFTGVIDIPVVVHVIHIGEAVGTGSNISNAQILGAIQGMNDKYKAMNGFGVDMQINFCLASRDPSGNPTTGINRVNGSGVTNYVSSGMYAIAGVSPGSCFNNYSAIKDLSKWPTASYLNIWVVYKYCLASGYNLYGQATGQTGGVYDGVTVLYSQMTQASITPAHECGHMLLLNHTFQGDGGGGVCPVDTSCANNGDLVCDTPPHKQGDIGITNPCTASGIWNNSRYNYMGYAWALDPVTFDATNCRFTQGQKDRARAAIYALTTENYLNSTGCMPPSPADAGIKNIIYPIATTYTSNCAFPNSFVPVVQLKNYGLTTLTSVTIKYNTDSNPLSTYNWSGSLLKDSTINLTLPALSSSAGVHSFLAFTTNPNGTIDGYSLNDSASKTMNYLLQPTSSLGLSTSVVNVTCAGGANGSATVTAVSSPSKFIVKEDFESGSTDWMMMNGSEINHWMIGTAVASTGSKGLYVTVDNVTSAYQLNASSSVHFYKDFYFPVGATNIKVKFDWKCDGEPGGFSGVDRLRVYLVPTSVFPQPGYQIGVSPYVLYAIGSYYSQSTFRTDSIMGLDGYAGTIQRLDFNWRNNASGGVQSPAAIDNIIVSYDLPAISTYNYTWSTAPVQTTATATALTANTYNVVVTDANNCTGSISALVSQPAPFSVNVTAGGPTSICPGDSVILSSTAAASYLWSNGAITQNTTVTSAGSYSVTGTNASGCTGTSPSVTVTILPAGSCVTGIAEGELSDLKIFPNPASNYLNIEGSVPNGNYRFVLQNAIGQLLSSESLKIENRLLSKTITVGGFPEGIYFLTIESDDSRIIRKIVK